jgi:hypothetical protein
MEIEAAAEREVSRINKIMPKVKAIKVEGEELISFAKNYASDAEFFLKKSKFVEAFEAAIIAWAYVDIGFKQDLLEVPENLRKNFSK